ncbi:Hypothetical protein NTJ_08805 [Nesidiocoris tenuis]|uniref:Tc1-like transposase DDE domain-containing protein n=1 Tax=Nesidiocoris tenuis TaxID=355587 RepID=A0ABN7AUX1_9HEMI|nr:Hypothetical protein NTJ_08805 [Nesidiocoris tenuis]
MPTCTVLSIFWDCEGLLTIDYFPLRKSINRFDYAFLLLKMDSSLKATRGNRADRNLLLHDNSAAHKSKIVRSILERLKIEELDHPPYSPDLSPTDYHIFEKLKRDILRDRRHMGLGKLKSEIDEFFRNFGPEFYFDGLRQLVVKHRRCISNKGL